jgi:hypothetical protein
MWVLGRDVTVQRRARDVSRQVGFVAEDHPHLAFCPCPYRDDEGSWFATLYPTHPLVEYFDTNMLETPMAR